MLETGCHFLGQPIPLIYEDSDDYTTLLTVGGLYLIYESNTESALPLFFVIDPKLTLEEIVRLLPNSRRNALVNVAVLDRTTGEEIRRLLPTRRWEARHGIFRWQEFRERGGKFDDYWLESESSGKVFDDDICSESVRDWVLHHTFNIISYDS
ncbi:hypothetical protein BC629DRAFT_1012307 [Irpex lacteus]|nr:hypothetical protein BC629DRAFT_1012307 [Irpex lacteus]